MAWFVSPSVNGELSLGGGVFPGLAMSTTGRATVTFVTSEAAALTSPSKLYVTSVLSQRCAARTLVALLDTVAV